MSFIHRASQGFLIVFLYGLLLHAQISPRSVKELKHFSAQEAKQGVATDAHFFYAISNREIGKYKKNSGVRVGEWQGNPKEFIHINNCIVRGQRLICAMSNYPNLPMTSSVEEFDTRTMKHVSSRSLGETPGSLTWIDWKNGSWWACLANYDGKGGDPSRSHDKSVFVQYSKEFVEQRRWYFPKNVLERFGTHSASGGRWGKGGLLYVTGHNLPELYVLRLPSSGDRLEYVRTIRLTTDGQAFDWDDNNSHRIWTVERKARAVVEGEVPER